MNRAALARPSRAGTGTGTALTRAVAIACSAFANKRHIQTELPNWRGGKDVELLIRAATSPATMTGSGWADMLAMTSVADFISVLAPSSAGSDLLKRGMQLEFKGAAAITVPTIIAAASGTSFVKEADPIPNRQFSFNGPRLEPRKFATLVEFTHEVFEHSTPTIESLVRAALVESVGLALDAALFSNTAGDATRPPGLLVGISPLPTPSTVMKDVTALATAVARVAGNGPIVFVTAPEQAATLALTFPFLFPYTVLVSSALAAGTVIAIAANAVASATDPAPRFDISNRATYVERDDPAPISTAGTIAVPTRSLWQTDTLSLKMVFEMSWCLRHASGLAWMQNVLW